MATYAGKPSSFFASTGGVPVEGAWYSGQRYVGGQLLAPGEYEPGKQTSPEVIAQTSPANVQYIQQQQQQYQQAQPKSEEEVTPYLNQYQKQLLEATQAPQTRVSTMEELKTKLAPSVPYPEPLNRVAELQKLRTEAGVTDLEQSLTAIKDSIEAEYNTLRQARGIEQGKPVPLGVIAGRISEQERTAQERIDALGRQQTRIVNELNTKYNVINQIMTLQGLDYGDAVKRYETEFDMNVKMYDIIAGERKEARSEYEFDQQAAKANLQIYVNAITSGNLDYSSMSDDQKVMVSKLEAQSGLPIGFVSNIKMNPKDRIFSVNEKTGEALIIQPDGSFKVVQTGMRPTPTEAGKTATATSAMQSKLLELGGEDYLVSPQEWKQQRAIWQAAGYDVADFDKAFKDQFVDWSHPQDYGLNMEKREEIF